MGSRDLIGKGGHMRTVPVPGWVKANVDIWVSSAGLQSGILFRPVGKTGKVRSTGFTAKVIWSIVRKAAADCDFGARALASATKQDGSWSRSNSFAGTSLSRLRSVIWGASNGSGTP